MRWLEKRIRLPALLAGVAADWFATAALLTLLGFAFGMSLGDDGVDQLVSSAPFLILGALLGSACTVLGGYVAGEVAGEEEILHAGFVGVLSLILGAVVEFVTRGTGAVAVPVWYQTLSYLVVVPAALLGGLLSHRRRSGAGLGGSLP